MTVDRKAVAAVVGDARAGDEQAALAEELGEAIVDAGYRLVTGGLGGVMRAASLGARRARGHSPGDVIGIVPTYSAADANELVEIVICTGLHHARNVLVVASADVVFAIGGKSGTLSEIAFAWKLAKPIIVVGDGGGWGPRLAGRALDERREEVVHGPLGPREAVRLAGELLARGRPPAGGF